MDISHTYPYTFQSYRGICVFFKGGDLELGEVLYYYGDTFEEKIVNIFRDEGISFVTKLNHSFVLFLWDVHTHEAYLVRDRFGIEPVYFKVENAQVSFAQSIAALRQSEGVDASKVYSYLVGKDSGENVPDSGTFFQGIRIVPPGCYIYSDSEGMVCCKAYWQCELPDVTTKKEEWLFEEFRSLMFKSVLSSVHGRQGVGTHLSGGLDSSLVTLVYSEIRKTTFPTFYFYFPGLRHTDLYYADLVTNRTGCPHYRIFPEDNVYASLYRLSKSSLAPENFILPSGIHYSIGNAALELGCDSILTGNDGDSVVGHGYTYLKELRRDDFSAFVTHLVQLRSNPGDTPAQVTEVRNRVLGKEIVQALQGRDLKKVLEMIRLAKAKFGYVPSAFLRYLANAVHRRWYAERRVRQMEYFLRKESLMPMPESERFVANDLYDLSSAEIVDNFKAAVNAGFSAHFEQFFAMEQDTGVRYLHPFFNKELFELCLAIPDKMRFGNGQTRWLMRNAMKDLLPEELYRRRDKDEFSYYLIASCKSLWRNNRSRFEENKMLWYYVNKPRFTKQMDVLTAGKYPVELCHSMARKLNRIMYLGVWLDTIKT